MKAIRALVWKEHREALPYLLIGLGVFVGLPLIGMLQVKLTGNLKIRLEAAPWVEALGGLLAAFVAVGLSCRDRGARLEDFWRSRPINVAAWLFIKYCVGLATVLISCILPLTLQIIFNGEDSPTEAPLRVLIWSPFVWIALYSVGFAAGCLVRRVAYSAMLTLAAALLMYFLPMLLPPIQWASLQRVTEQTADLSWRMSRSERLNAPGLPWLPWTVPYEVAQLRFIAVWLVVSLAALMLAIIATRRNWWIESGVKLMYGAIGAAVLVLFASAASQLASNLPLIAAADLNDGQVAVALISDGHCGVIATTPAIDHSDGSPPHDAVRAIQVDGSSVKLGPPISLGSTRWFSGLRPAIAWDAQRPDYVYIVRAQWRVGEAKTELIILNLGEASAAMTKSAQLLLRDGEDGPYYVQAEMRIRGDRLDIYLSDQKLTVDIAEPLRPRLVGPPTTRPRSPGILEDVQTISTYVGADSPTGDSSSIDEALGSFDSIWIARHDDVIARIAAEGLLIYRAKIEGPGWAEIRKVGQYDRSFVDRLFGEQPRELTMGKNVVAVSTAGGAITGQTSYLTLYDLSNPSRPRPTGHFAAPDEVLTACPLPDGRLLAGGRRIYLLGTAPGRK